MKNIWKKHKAEIISGGCCLATIVLFYFGFLPYENKIKNQADRIQETELENQIFEKKTSKISQMEEKFSDYQNNKDKMGKFLQNGEEVGLIERIESLGEETKNKVKLSILEVDAQKNKDTTSLKNTTKEENILKDVPSQNFLSLEINLEGDYQGLLDFLKKIESMDYYVDVISLDLAEIADAGNPANLYSNNLFSSGQVVPAVKVSRGILKSKINIIVFKN
jgi:hypothetical protein